MKTQLQKSDERGHAQHGWLDTYHSFSFANFYDPKKIRFGLLRVLNDDYIDAGQGFGMHPHDNMEIVTIPLSGALQHRDSMGNSSIIKKGDVQIMSAGTGIKHSEFNPSNTEAVTLLQIWVFPKVENIKPRYDQKTFLPETRKNIFQAVVAPDNSEALLINQDAWFSLGNFDLGKSATYKVNKKDNGLYLFVISGTVEVGGQLLNKRDALEITETDSLEIKSNSESEILIIEVPMD